MRNDIETTSADGDRNSKPSSFLLQPLAPEFGLDDPRDAYADLAFEVENEDEKTLNGTW